MVILWTPPSVRPSRILLLNHWAELNQTFYMTSYAIRVCKSNIIFPFVHPSVRASICPSHYFLLNHWVEFNQTCYMTSLMVKVCESVRPSICHVISNISTQRGDFIIIIVIIIVGVVVVVDVVLPVILISLTIVVFNSELVKHQSK